MKTKTKPLMIAGVKLLKNGVRGTDGKYHPVYYSIGRLYEKRTVGETGPMRTYEAATIYAREYDRLPAELNPKNDSDSMTDYFEKDRAVFRKGTPEYDLIMLAAGKVPAPVEEQPEAVPSNVVPFVAPVGDSVPAGMVGL